MYFIYTLKKMITFISVPVGGSARQTVEHRIQT